MFIRFIGLSFLMPGVVFSQLPEAFAIPARTWRSYRRHTGHHCDSWSFEKNAWAIASVWLFNVWGAADLVFAFVQGARAQLNPGDLGAAYFIVTAIVPYS